MAPSRGAPCGAEDAFCADTFRYVGANRTGAAKTVAAAAVAQQPGSLSGEG